MSVLNIQIFVDVIALLVDSPVEAAVFLYDDSPVTSAGRGTPQLRSPVYPGQLVRWSLAPIDVQTPVWLDSLTFGPHPADLSDGVQIPDPPRQDPIWARRWEGYVPWGLLPGADYPYRLTLGFGGAIKRLLTIDGPSLVYAPPLAAQVSAQAASAAQGAGAAI
ncbi:hypothetical protein [Azospirillum soli]|uniref:hypothetical protein n=1 Tax=Azospirillum soli TaxID=1304799 RepID=UPI001AE7662B|nr:hypothetical protein [Azospirillum soli]MBP2314385.1 hypothetical protein [Azospirillum soli]